MTGRDKMDGRDFPRRSWVSSHFDKPWEYHLEEGQEMRNEEEKLVGRKWCV